MVTNKQLIEWYNALSPAKRNKLMRDITQDVRQEKEAAERRQVAATNQMDYSSFKRMFWNGYTETDFQLKIDAMLMDIATFIFTEGQQGISRGIINMPPRHGKTKNVSQMFPAWLLSRMPELPIIMVSYADALATRNSRTVRNIIQSARYQKLFPHMKLIGTRADEWYTSENGGVLAAGFNGGLTGSGAKLIIIDDPHKSRSEAESPTIRRRIQESYTDDLLTRLEEPGGCILLMQTRWRTDDLTGWLLADNESDDETDNEPDEWQVLKLPALARDNDPLGRAPGAALWAARYPVNLLEKRRDKMGTYSFESLYQQQPISKEDALFDCAKIEVIDDIPPLKEVVRFYDLAVSEKKTADYSAGVKVGITADETLIVLDMYRKQANPAQTGENIILNALRDGTSVKIRLEADNAARTQLSYLLKDERLRGYTIDAVSPDGSKYVRAAPLESRVNNGKLKIVRANWNASFLDEMSTFPGGRYDDQVDALSGSYALLSANNWSGVYHAMLKGTVGGLPARNRSFSSRKAKFAPRRGQLPRS
jgi:predicted phage terminase large subunit-like protein